MASVRGLAKRLLGNTFIWTLLLKARYHLLRGCRRMEEPFHRVIMMPLRRVYRKAVIRVLPEGLVCRWVDSQIQNQEFYGSSYFDAPREPGRESGYSEDYSEIEDFGEVARLSGELLGVRSALDVGCAKGFQVRALRRVGIEAWGIDLSEYAVGSAPEEVRGWLKACSIQDADFAEGSFDLVLAMELLEHIPVTDIEGVIRKLFIFTSRYVLATIPSFGPNPYGRDGWLEGKIDPGKIPYYRDHLIDLAEIKHLVLDSQGLPQHGHVLIASYDWWTAAFTRWGFLRRGDLEREINRTLASARRGVWCCYLFQKAVKVAGRREKVSLRREDFAPRGGGWESIAFFLPEGTSRLELDLEVRDIKRRGPARERAVSLACLSRGGEIVNGQRLLTRRELLDKGGDGLLKTSLLCNAVENGPAFLRVVSGPGFLFTPLYAEITVL